MDRQTEPELLSELKIVNHFLTLCFTPKISDCGVLLPIATQDDSTIFLSDLVNHALDLMPVKKGANF